MSLVGSCRMSSAADRDPVEPMKTSKSVEQSSIFAVRSSAVTFWRRAVWMRLGAINGLFALSVLLMSDQPMFMPGHSALVRLAAQVQFMHGMATLACATFMNVGAKGARLAPPFFLAGIVLYCLPLYGEALGLFGSTAMLKQLGFGVFGMGWLIMVWSARDIDQA